MDETYWVYVNFLWVNFQERLYHSCSIKWHSRSDISDVECDSTLTIAKLTHFCDLYECVCELNREVKLSQVLYAYRILVYVHECSTLVKTVNRIGLTMDIHFSTYIGSIGPTVLKLSFLLSLTSFTQPLKPKVKHFYQSLLQPTLSW